MSDLATALQPPKKRSSAQASLSEIFSDGLQGMQKSLGLIGGPTTDGKDKKYKDILITPQGQITTAGGALEDAYIAGSK